MMLRVKNIFSPLRFMYEYRLPLFFINLHSFFPLSTLIITCASSRCISASKLLALTRNPFFLPTLQSQPSKSSPTTNMPLCHRLNSNHSCERRMLLSLAIQSPTLILTKKGCKHCRRCTFPCPSKVCDIFLCLSMMYFITYLSRRYRFFCCARGW